MWSLLWEDHDHQGVRLERPQARPTMTVLSSWDESRLAPPHLLWNLASLQVPLFFNATSNGALSSHLRLGRRNLLTRLTIATSRPLDSISKTSTSCPCRRYLGLQRTQLPAGTSLPLVGASSSLPSSSNAYISKPRPPSCFRAQLRFFASTRTSWICSGRGILLHFALLSSFLLHLLWSLDDWLPGEYSSVSPIAPASWTLGIGIVTLLEKWNGSVYCFSGAVFYSCGWGPTSEW